MIVDIMLELIGADDIEICDITGPVQAKKLNVEKKLIVNFKLSWPNIIKIKQDNIEIIQMAINEFNISKKNIAKIYSNSEIKLDKENPTRWLLLNCNEFEIARIKDIK
jgi:hypothetical protein